MDVQKKWIGFLMILGGLSLSAQSEQDSFRHQKVETSAIIDRDAKKVWKLISDFHNLGLLAPDIIQKMEVNGKKRASSWIITTKDGAVIKEEMITFNQKEMVLSYRMTETPMPLRNYIGRFKVRPEKTGGCKVIFTATFEAKSDVMPGLISTFKAFQATFLSNIEGQIW